MDTLTRIKILRFAHAYIKRSPIDDVIARAPRPQNYLGSWSIATERPLHQGPLSLGGNYGSSALDVANGKHDGPIGELDVLTRKELGNRHFVTLLLDHSDSNDPLWPNALQDLEKIIESR